MRIVNVKAKILSEIYGQQNIRKSIINYSKINLKLEVNFNDKNYVI